jgi:hypothetical protein
MASCEVVNKLHPTLQWSGQPTAQVLWWCLKKPPDTVGEPTSTFQDRFSGVIFSSFFAFKEGMYETQISALLNSPTVSLRILGDYSIFTGFWYGSRGAFVV